MSVTLRDRVRAACAALPEPFTRAQVEAEVGPYVSPEVVKNTVNWLAIGGEIVRITDPVSRNVEQRFRRGTLESKDEARHSLAARAAATSHVDRLIRDWTARRHQPETT